MGDREFSASEEEGRLFCQTLLPERTTIVKIGGPGKQFWSDGRNWPLPSGYRTPDTTALLGQWRVEISPAAAQTDDYFLHLIQVGTRSLQRMVTSRLIRSSGMAGVHFQTGDGEEWEVSFAESGPVGGHIRYKLRGALVLDRDLIRSVMAQSGLYGR